MLVSATRPNEWLRNMQKENELMRLSKGLVRTGSGSDRVDLSEPEAVTTELTLEDPVATTPGTDKPDHPRLPGLHQYLILE